MIYVYRIRGRECGKVKDKARRAVGDGNGALGMLALGHWKQKPLDAVGEEGNLR